MILLDTFSKLTDRRRRQGLRVTQSQVLTMVILAYVCGYFSYRKIATFAQAHKLLFIRELGLKHGVPTFVTFRDILVHIKEAELISAFNAWAQDFVPLDTQEWVSSDGKSLCSTVSDIHDKTQNFQSVVSFFAHKTGMVVLLEAYKNKKVSEIEVVTGMLNSLKDKHLHFVLDALHIQKKQ